MYNGGFSFIFLSLWKQKVNLTYLWEKNQSACLIKQKKYLCDAYSCYVLTVWGSPITRAPCSSQQSTNTFHHQSSVYSCLRGQWCPTHSTDYQVGVQLQKCDPGPHRFFYVNGDSCTSHSSTKFEYGLMRQCVRWYSVHHCTQQLELVRAYRLWLENWIMNNSFDFSPK